MTCTCNEACVFIDGVEVTKYVIGLISWTVEGNE